MKFARIGAAGAEVPVAEVDGILFDLRSITDDIDGEFLSNDPVGVVTSAIGGLPTVEPDDAQRFGSPVARPSAVYCVGLCGFRKVSRM